MLQRKLVLGPQGGQPAHYTWDRPVPHLMNPTVLGNQPVRLPSARALPGRRCPHQGLKQRVGLPCGEPEVWPAERGPVKGSARVWGEEGAGMGKEVDQRSKHIKDNGNQLSHCWKSKLCLWKGRTSERTRCGNWNQRLSMRTCVFQYTSIDGEVNTDLGEKGCVCSMCV